MGGGVTSTPIPIVEADLDALVDIDLGHAPDGQRVWVEVARQSQVIGIMEMTAMNGRLSAPDIKEKAAQFDGVTVSPYVTLDRALLPTMTVVVPTICQHPERLQLTVEHLLMLNYPKFDIVVVDNRPDPGRPALPEFSDVERVREFWEPQRGVSSARNCGAAYATGEIVAFTDDDAEVDSDWLLAIGTRFATCPEIDGVSGLVLPMELRTTPQLWFEEFFGGFNQSFSAELLSMELLADDPLFPYATGRFGAGVNMALRRSAIAAKGGFDVTLGVGTPARGGEDLAILMKQVLTGGTLAFEPRAIVRHQHRETEREFFDQVFGYGTGLTAMFTALIVHDPRHLARMLRRLPRGIRLLTRPRDERSPSVHSTYPRKTYAHHLNGMMYGPFAYARSVARRRWGR